MRVGFAENDSARDFYAYDTLPHQFEVVSAPFAKGQSGHVFLSIGGGFDKSAELEPPVPHTMTARNLRVWPVRTGPYQTHAIRKYP